MSGSRQAGRYRLYLNIFLRFAANSKRQREIKTMWLWATRVTTFYHHHLQGNLRCESVSTRTAAPPKKGPLLLLTTTVLPGLQKIPTSQHPQSYQKTRSTSTPAQQHIAQSIQLQHRKINFDNANLAHLNFALMLKLPIQYRVQPPYRASNNHNQSAKHDVA
jgi:hypothetical protein